MSDDKKLIPGSVTALDSNPPDRRVTERRSLIQAEPAPTEGTGPAIWDLVISDLDKRWRLTESRSQRMIYKLMIEDSQARDDFGKNKYGKRLRCEDGRDALVDGYQEVLDLAVYLRKELQTNYTENLRVIYGDTLYLWYRIRSTILQRDGK